MVKLTPRQSRIVEILSHGYSQDDAARELGTSPQVISEDLKRARIRQGYGNTVALVRSFVQTGGAYAAADELPDADEPQGPVQRCNLCGLVLPHECVSVSATDRVVWPVGGIESAMDDLTDQRTRPLMTSIGVRYPSSVGRS